MVGGHCIPFEPRYHAKHKFSCKNSAKMFSLEYSHLRQFLANLVETLHFYYYCDKFDDEFRFLKKGIFINVTLA